MTKLLKKLFGRYEAGSKKAQKGATQITRETHRHEIPSKQISERFGRAIERLADK